MYIYNILKSKPEAKIEGFKDVVSCVSESKKDEKFLCGSYDGSIKVFSK